MDNIILKEGEFLKPINGFEQRYLVSSHGRIFSLNGRHNGLFELNPCLGKINNKDAYYVVALRDKKNNITRITKRVHQIVAENFLEKPFSDKMLCVNHKDGDKLNNNFTNLEWVTPFENCNHAIKIGLVDRKGEKHKNAKLNRNDIYKIREYHSLGYSSEKIASLFDYKVNRRHITDILNKKCWGWLV